MGTVKIKMEANQTENKTKSPDASARLVKPTNLTKAHSDNKNTAERGAITRDPQDNEATTEGILCTLKKQHRQENHMPPCYVFWLPKQTSNSCHGNVKQAGRGGDSRDSRWHLV